MDTGASQSRWLAPSPQHSQHEQSHSSPDAGSGDANPKTSRRSRASKKRFAPKTRTGCKTCRARRVKCDEGKPSCRKCVKGDHICQYEPDKTKYFPAKQFQSDVRAFNASRGRDLQFLQALLPVYGTAEETCYLDKFLSLTAPWLAKYNEASFFYTVLPQRSWHHPALRHSLVALAMASERVRTPETFTRALQHRWHYNQALRHVYSAKDTEEDVVLLTSAMFWLHDNVTSSSETAMVHLQGFLRILTERKIRRAQKRFSESDFESHILRGLVFSADIAEDGLAETVEPNLVQNIRSRLRDPKYTRRFRTMEEVRNELRLGLSAVPYSSRLSPNSSTQRKNEHDDSTAISVLELRIYLERWYRAFSSVPTISYVDRILLECHYICVALYLQVHQLNTGTSSDPAASIDDPQSNSRLEYILSRLDEIDVASFQQAPISKDNELPLIPILSQVIVMSKPGPIRKKAFRYLRSLNRVEGMWSTAVVADMMSASHPAEVEDDNERPLGTAQGIPTSRNNSQASASDYSAFGPDHDPTSDESTPGDPLSSGNRGYRTDRDVVEAEMMADAVKAIELYKRTSPDAQFDESSIRPMRSLNEKVNSRVRQMRSHGSNSPAGQDSDEEVAWEMPRTGAFCGEEYWTRRTSSPLRPPPDAEPSTRRGE